ncbi:16S rRNA (uracil(1498)-N(3))-methyltransferase [Psychrobacter lutiphocae]|uniref:16S rRNA (uracil(1498)-N(3))-methyltransferase n=1 Tax=Psychrobacter lutiphocae TaxID=540500 RepID=UPI0003781734|nr:16S rRNA (uracil(1498)-N(3))-methyltransferase [Psychrobacter lutiphocae]
MNIVLLDQMAGTQDSKKSHSRQDATDTVFITELAQVRHIQQVLKLKVGERLKVGQVNGALGSAQIAQILTDKVVLTDIELDSKPPTKLDLKIVLALPRPKVLRRLIMDMTAIGVSDIVLVNSYRSDKSYWQSPMLKRLDEFVIAGLQQGVDTVPPTIHLKQRFKPFVEDELPQMIAGKRAAVMHPYAIASFSEFTNDGGLPQLLCIGAEGGWIDYEVQLFQAQGCQALNLGDRILRTEAVVNALCGRYL